MEEMFETLPQHTCSWSKGQTTLYKYQGFWNLKDFHEKVILAQQSFKARPTDVFLCSYPKSGTTWLKALGFAIVTREKYNESTSPLLTKMPHECTLYLEQDLEKILESRNNSHSIPLVSTHLPYACLPESVKASNCKIVYIYRNIKDVIVSYYHFLRNILQLSVEDAPFNEACEEFCQGISIFGSYWDHILGYWKAIQERPERFLLLKYEDMKRGAPSEVKKLAEFIGYPFTIEEERAGVIENIVKLCSFESLSNFQVNKNGMQQPGEDSEVENRLFFRKGEVGDWENYFTDEWKEKIDRMIDQKLSGTDLVLK